MIRIAITLILVGCSPIIGREVFDESGEIQSSDPTLESSEDIFRLKLPEDEVEDTSGELKTIKTDKEYDVGKILSHLQIVQRPRPVINLRPIGGHTVIHKNNNDQQQQHVSHHDEYIPVKLSSDTEYVIKPQYDSHYHQGKPIVKPESYDHYYHKPEYNHHEEYNHGYGHYNHGNGYNHGHGQEDYGHDHHGHKNHDYNYHGNDDHGYDNHEHDNHGYGNHDHGHEGSDHGYNNHGNGNHGHGDHEYNNHGNDKNEYNNHKYNKHEHYNNGYNNGEHNNHRYNNHGHDNHGYDNHGHDNHAYNSDKYPQHKPTHPNHYHGKPDDHHNHVSHHGSYSHSSRPHGKPNGYNRPHHDYGHNKPHQEHGSNGYHHDHKYDAPHENYHGEHKPHHGGNKPYHGGNKPHHGGNKPHHGGNKHHHDHKPYNHGHSHHKYNENPQSHHDNHRPYHNGYESHSHSSYYKPHYSYEVYEKEEDDISHKPSHNKPHKQHNDGLHNNQHTSHKPTDHVHKPSKPVHKPNRENNHHLPSKPHGNSHKYHAQSSIQESLWKPFMSGVNSHNTDKHEQKPKNYQQLYQSGEIESDLEYLIDLDNGAATFMEKLDSGFNPGKNTPVKHKKEGLQSTSPKPGSLQMKINSTKVVTMNNSHGNKINGKPSQNQSGGQMGNKNKPNNLNKQHTSKPNKTLPINTQTNSGNTLKPQQMMSSFEKPKPSMTSFEKPKPSMTSFEKPKPILVSSTTRPIMSINQGSETPLNVSKPDQKPNQIEQKPENNYHHSNEHYNNYYEVTESLFSSNEDTSGSEEDSNYHYFNSKPNKEDSAEALVDNSQEDTSSYGNNIDNPYSSAEYVGGHQLEESYHDQNLHGNKHEQYSLNEEGSDEVSEEDYHDTYSQENPHQSNPHHGNNPQRHQSYPQKASHYIPGPNNCGSAPHEQKLQEFHKEYFRPSYDQQNSHSNHHNYYGQPVKNHHTHQVTKPFNIEHGGPYGGVSGIFINNFKKRPSSWYSDGEREYDDSQEILGDGYDENYRERRDEYYREERSPFEREGEENYFKKPVTSENSFKNLLNLNSRTSESSFGKPTSRQNHHTGSDIHEETSRNIIADIIVTNIKDRIPSTLGYNLENEENKEAMYEAEKALTYVMNPYAYVGRPQHDGLQYSTHQNFLVNPNHHQQSVYNYVQPHHEHQSNYHDYGTQKPHHYYQEVVHPLGYNPSLHNTGHHNSPGYDHNLGTFHGHNTGHHNSHGNNHAEEISHGYNTGHHSSHVQNHGVSHSHNSKETPVKYVYIPVLYNFQPSSTNLNSLSNLKLNRSNAGYFNNLDLSGLETVMRSQENIMGPTLNFFRTPTRNSEPVPVISPQVTQGSSTPLLLQLLSDPSNFETFSENEGLNFRDGGEYLRTVEPLKREVEVEKSLEKEDNKFEIEKTPSTSNWHQTQELHEDFATKCKDIWDSILLAQETDTKIQERSLSKSNEEVKTEFQDLERKVESLIKKRKRSNTLESGADQELKDSLESTCIEVLKNALLAQLEILDIKRREELNKNQSQTMVKLDADKEKLADGPVVDTGKVVDTRKVVDTVSQLEAMESAANSKKTDEEKEEDLPITFEKEAVILDDSEDEQDSQDYHW